MSSIDEIKARIDIVDLVSETVKLRRAGKNYTGFCPFHQNSRTPAFVVFPDSGTWRCFGQCNEGGDIFKYVMKKEGWDFAETLQHLAQRAGVVLEAPTAQKKEEEDQHERLRALLEDAVTFYRHHLLQTPAGKPALDFLERRGLTQETIEQFGLGYAPFSWDAALNYFAGRGYSPAELLEVGLVTERRGEDGNLKENGGVYDRFRNRVMFPIRDGMGRMAGFGARILNPEDMPKFLNSPQTALFDKGRLLYGLDQARKAIRAQDQVVIVEGYLDVIVLHQGGFRNTVSPMGTALTEDQVRYLKRFTRRMVLALDADAAGAKATLRGLEVARQAMDHSPEMSFDARGLLRNEARLQADLRVTTIPEGMDPDEVVLRNPAEWEQILAAAQPIVIHVMETLAAAQNLEDPKVKRDVAAQILPLIEDVPDPVERDAYRQRLARLLRVDERSLLGSSPTGGTSVRRPTRRREQQAAAAAALTDRVKLHAGLEEHSLCLLLRQPEALYLLDRNLQNAGLIRFAPEDFDRADYQLLVRLVISSLEQDQMEPQRFLEENLPAELEEVFQTLKTPLEKGEPTADKLVEDLVRTVVRLRSERISAGLNQIRFFQQDLQEQGEIQIDAYRELVLQYAQTLARLNRLIGQPVQLD